MSSFLKIPWIVSLNNWTALNYQSPYYQQASLLYEILTHNYAVRGNIRMSGWSAVYLRRQYCFLANILPFLLLPILSPFLNLGMGDWQNHMWASTWFESSSISSFLLVLGGGLTWKQITIRSDLTSFNHEGLTRSCHRLLIMFLCRLSPCSLYDRVNKDLFMLLPTENLSNTNLLFSKAWKYSSRSIIPSRSLLHQWFDNV